MPAYLQVSNQLSNKAGSGRQVTRPQHQERLSNWVKALHASPWFRRSGGRDHLFSVGDLNPGWAAEAGLQVVKAAMGTGFTGTFEMNDAWAGGWEAERMIAMPYVAADDIVAPAMSASAWGGSARVSHSSRRPVWPGRRREEDPRRFTIDPSVSAVLMRQAEDVDGFAAAVATEARAARKVSLYFAASERKNAIGWANCTRRELEKLDTFPHAVVHVSSRRRRLTDEAIGGSLGAQFGGRKQQRRRRLESKARHSESAFADHMRGAALCPLMSAPPPHPHARSRHTSVANPLARTHRPIGQKHEYEVCVRRYS